MPLNNAMLKLPSAWPQFELFPARVETYPFIYWFFYLVFFNINISLFNFPSLDFHIRTAFIPVELIFLIAQLSPT